MPCVFMNTESTQAAKPLDMSEAHRNAAMSLLLPGKVLHLNALLAMRKFWNSGNKPGAVRGFEELQANNLGKIISEKPQRGATMVCMYMHVYSCMCMYTCCYQAGNLRGNAHVVCVCFFFPT